MALSTHPGGAADKAGMIHETLWGVHAMLLVLEGEALSIRIETPGDDGAEFQLKYSDTLEHWQAKRQITGQDTWSLQKLKTEGILTFFFGKFKIGESCVFASVSDSPDLRVLIENASASKSLEEFKKHFLNIKRSKLFADLSKHVGSTSEEETYEFLKSIRVEGGREITLESMLERLIQSRFNGPWQASRSFLNDLFVHSSHETLVAADIEAYLEKRGISRRTIGADSKSLIEGVTSSYISGQRAKLISNTLQSRKEAEDSIAKIIQSETSLDFLVTGNAGCGKSACLLQIVEGLQAANIPVLAFRLDRVSPVLSTKKLGESLGMSESPAVVLAKTFSEQPVVIVLDQLDCVSSTSGRHPAFFDTVASLSDEILGLRFNRTIHFIAACRKFDFDHDHRLKQLIPKDQSPINLGNFTDNEVNEIIRNEGGNSTGLSPLQKNMLRLPQNLSMYINARLFEADNRFTTPKELCDDYWTSKLRIITKARPEFHEYWLPAIVSLTKLMSDRQELSVPAKFMDEFPRDFLDLMASEGVLTWDGRRYGFGHETFFDYCFARTQPNDGRDFVSFLESDSQHLFRRSQLRQVLAFLRDDDVSVYLQAVRKILNSKHIRYHLKLLAVELVTSHPEPTDAEFDLLQPWINAELTRRRAKKAPQPNPLTLYYRKLANKVVRYWWKLKGQDYGNHIKLTSRIWERFYFSRTMFIVADRTGLIEKWLASNEPWALDMTAHYFRWQTDSHAERISELLEPFIDKEDWQVRFRYLMEGHDLEKSRRFFELFLTLLKKGRIDDAKSRMAVNGTFWSMLYGLAEEHPSWCGELAACWLDRQVLLASNNADQSDPHSILSDDFGVNDLFTSAKGAPKEFLYNLVPSVLQAAETFSYGEDEEEFSRDKIWGHRTHGDHIGMSEAYLGACEEAIKLLGADSAELLRPTIDQLIVARLYTANQLLMNVYLSAPDAFADEALSLLASQPKRLSSGYSDSAYWTTKQVIEKCSPHCSDEVFQEIEAILTSFASPYEKTKKGMKYRGNAAYNFTSALCKPRISDSTKSLLLEWSHKFEAPDGPPMGIRSYTVESPIEKESAEHMTDDHWLGAIAKYNSEERNYNYKHPERGAALELARMLEKFTKEDPARFANLALQFPDQTHPYYFSHVLSGIHDAEISFEDKLTVARKMFDIDQRACYRATLSLLGKGGGQLLPADAIQYIKKAAIHPNPETEDWDGKDPYYGGCILTSGINSVRGYAAEAIRNLLYKDVCYLETFRTTIEDLVDDPSLAVRSVTASTLHAVARYDEDLAVRWVIELVNTDDRLLATSYVQDFLKNGLTNHYDEFFPIISRMLKSSDEKVRKKGGLLAGLARLHHEKATDLCKTALAGDEYCRLGVCKVASSNLLSKECHEWCENTLMHLFSDPEESVRKEAAHCFWHLWQSPDLPLKEFESLISAFIDTKAFTDDPTYLLHAINETRHPVPEVTLDICENFITRCGKEARDIRTSLAGDERTIGKLVFTAYAQLGKNQQQQALDVIDMMCLEGLHSAGTHLSEIER